MSGAICGVSRGRYGEPMLLSEMKINWEDDDGNIIKVPKKFACEHPNHWQWGKGTRNGQKLYYPINEIYYQEWILTKEEFMEAVECYDIFSIEMTGRNICQNCKDNISK